MALCVDETTYIRSGYSPRYDVVVSMRRGANGQMDFARTTLIPVGAPNTTEAYRAGELIHACTDDAAPWFINDTYIGANHGAYAVMQVTSAHHGMTATDLGGAWLDDEGVNFYLLRILDEDTLWFLSENRGKGDIWQFVMQISGDTLRQNGGEKTLPIEKVVKTQLIPSCRITRQIVQVDGKAVLPEGPPVSCETVEVVESYDIINPASLLELVREQAGRETDFTDDRLEAVLSNTIHYRFKPGGACLIRHEATARQAFGLGYVGFMQSRVMVCKKADTLGYYIPGTLPFEVDGHRYDFGEIQDFSEPPASPLTFSHAKGNVVSADGLPARFIQLLGRKTDENEPLVAGYALGYSLTQGLTRLATRAENSGEALVIHTSRKTYPRAIDKYKRRRIEAGATFECVGYRQYFDPKAASEAATSVYWHEEDGATMLYADYHQSVAGDVIKLPEAFAGASVIIIDATPSISLDSGSLVPGTGIVLSVTDDYGFIVLRLEQVPVSNEKRMKS